MPTAVAGVPAGGAGPNQTAQEFAIANGLDEKCSEILVNCSPEVQQYVICQGPADGRNPSAMVMARIAKCSNATPGQAVGVAGGLYPMTLSGTPIAGAQMTTGVLMTGQGDIPQKVEEFIVANSLDEKCAEAFRVQSQPCQVAVMNLGPAEGRNASAMIMAE